jgi:cytochrome c peroxidase
MSSFRKRISLKGKGPRHVLSISGILYITCYFSDAIEIVDLNQNRAGKNFVKLGAGETTITAERYGEQLFHDAGQCFQQWQSCASCHPGDARVDGLNWDLMNDGFGNPKNTKSLLHSYFTPPAMATGVRADAKMATRAGFRHIQFHNVNEADANAVDAYIKSLTPVPSPLLSKGRLSKEARKGKAIFKSASCTHCHHGPYFTDGQKYEIGRLGTLDKQNMWDTPTLIELWRTAPYMHDGRYATLKEVFTLEKHGLDKPMSEEQIDQLIAYLMSL